MTLKGLSKNAKIFQFVFFFYPKKPVLTSFQFQVFKLRCPPGSYCIFIFISNETVSAILITIMFVYNYEEAIRTLLGVGCNDTYFNLANDFQQSAKSKL